jgi:hypothetical protein
MIFLDRLTGGKLSRLPDALLPGRYCLLEPLVVNGHSRFSSPVICSRMTARASSGFKTLNHKCSPSISLTTIRRTPICLQRRLFPSPEKSLTHMMQMSRPMLPAEMAAQVALEELERDFGDGTQRWSSAFNI